MATTAAALFPPSVGTTTSHASIDSMQQQQQDAPPHSPANTNDGGGGGGATNGGGNGGDDDEYMMLDNMVAGAAVTEFRPFSAPSRLLNSAATAKSDGTLVLAQSSGGGGALAKASTVQLGSNRYITEELSARLREEYAMLDESSADQVIDIEHLDEIGTPLGGGITMRAVVLSQNVGKESLWVTVTPVDTPARCISSKNIGDQHMVIEPTGAVLLPFIGKTPQARVPDAFWKEYLKTLKPNAASKVTAWARTIAATRVTSSSVFAVSLYGTKELLKNVRTGKPVAPGEVVTLSGLRFQYIEGEKESKVAAALCSATRVSIERAPNALLEVLQRLRSSPNLQSLDFVRAIHTIKPLLVHPWDVDEDGQLLSGVAIGPDAECFSRSLREYPVRDADPTFFALQLGDHALDVNKKQNEWISKVGAPLVIADNDEHFVGEKMVNGKNEKVARARFTIPVTQRLIGSPAGTKPHRMDVALDLRDDYVRLFGTVGDNARLVSSMLPNAVGVVIVNPTESSSKQWSEGEPSTQAYCKGLLIAPYLPVTVVRSGYEIPYALVKQLFKQQGYPAEVPNPINESAEHGVLCLSRSKYSASAEELEKLHGTKRYTYHVVTRHTVTPALRAERGVLQAAGVNIARLNSHLLFGTKFDSATVIPPLHKAVPVIAGTTNLTAVFAVDNESLARATRLVDFSDIPLASDVATAISAAAAVRRIGDKRTAADTETEPVPDSKRRGAAITQDQLD